jgi:hypothetical protein
MNQHLRDAARHAEQARAHAHDALLALGRGIQDREDPRPPPERLTTPEVSFQGARWELGTMDPPDSTAPDHELEARPGGARQILTGEQSIGKGGESVIFQDIEFQTPQRAGVHAGHHKSLTVAASRVAGFYHRLNNCLFIPRDPNFPASHGPQDGTLWAERLQGVRAADIVDTVIRLMGGNSYHHEDSPHPQTTQNEGHGLYWNASLTKDARLVLMRLGVLDGGGQAIQITNSESWANPRRGGWGPGDKTSFLTEMPDDDHVQGWESYPCEWGGQVWMEDCRFRNNTRSPVKGAAVITFYELLASYMLKNVEVFQDCDCPVWGWDGDPDSEFLYRSRGLLNIRGPGEEVIIQGGRFSQASPSTRAAISIGGPKRVVFEGVHIDGDVIINGEATKGQAATTWSGDGLYATYSGNGYWTQRVEMTGCTGSGRVFHGKNPTPIGHVGRDLRYGTPYGGLKYPAEQFWRQHSTSDLDQP